VGLSPIRIGARVNIQDGTIIHVSSKGIGTLIGDEVSIGHMTLIHACTLQTGSFVGMGAVVMDGADYGTFRYRVREYVGLGQRYRADHLKS
jgi:carbonic anhydrase/acetyltransferase-like protein (isoleucine patch superfamily)